MQWLHYSNITATVVKRTLMSRQQTDSLYAFLTLNDLTTYIKLIELLILRRNWGLVRPSVYICLENVVYLLFAVLREISYS